MEIRDARPEEFEATADLLANALIDDPGWVASAPVRETRMLILKILCREGMAMAQASGGGTWICEVEGRPAGALVWNSPDQTSIPMSTIVGGVFRSLPHVLAHPVSTVRTIRNILALEAIKPKQRMYYAVFLGAKVQGKGVGSRLLRKLIETCGDEDLYLETQNPENLKFYTKHGFTRTETLEETFKGGAGAFGLLHRAQRKLSAAV